MFERRVPHQVLGASLVGAALALACSTDTSGLARQPSPGGGPGGASGGFAPPDETAGAGGGGGAGTGGSGGGSAGRGGAGALHVVHGLVDGGDLFVCLREAGGAALGGDAPQPEAGVEYGRSYTIPVDWEPALDVEALLYVVAGGLAGRSCSELGELSQVPAPTLPDAGTADAAPSAPAFPLEPLEPRAAGAVRFPPGLLRAGTSYALVAAGCTGAGASEDVCGPPDLIFGSSQALALAEIDDQIVGAGGGSLGLQFLNASRAVARASVVLQGQVEQDSRRLAEDVRFGAIRPRDAAPAEEPLGVELHIEGASASDYTEAWADMIEAAGGAPVTPGSNYLLVYVGAEPRSSLGGLAPPRFVLVPGRAGAQ